MKVNMETEGKPKITLAIFSFNRFADQALNERTEIHFWIQHYSH